MTIDRSPARLSSALAVGAAFVAAGTAAIGSTLALVAGFIGVAILVIALLRQRRRLISLGTVGLLFAALLAGLQDAPVELLLITVTLAVLAWDIGSNAIVIGQQLGQDAVTDRIELVHAAGSGLVGLSSLTVGYGIFSLAGGGQPLSALVLLLLAALLLGGSFR